MLGAVDNKRIGLVVGSSGHRYVAWRLSLSVVEADEVGASLLLIERPGMLIVTVAGFDLPDSLTTTVILSHNILLGFCSTLRTNLNQESIITIKGYNAKIF